MKVNIVMLTKDRPEITAQALRTLHRNTPQDLYNLTVIDDGGSMPPPVGRGSGYLHIAWSDGITAMARNLGVYWAENYWRRGDYLYLSDNDVYFTPGWLEKMLIAMEKCEPDLRLLGGWNHPYHLTNEIRNIPFSMAVHMNHALAGASQLMRWQVWDSYGPLKHGAPGVCQGEDVIFSEKIAADRGKIGVISPHVVLNAGVTNSHGQPAPGADLMVMELEAAKKLYPDLIWK